MYKVIKRDGIIVEFDIKKICLAITKAFEAQKRQYHSTVIDMLALRVTSDFEPKIKKEINTSRRHSRQCGKNLE